MRLAEAAKRLGVARKTVYRYVERGCPSHTDDHGVQHVDVDVVRQWMTEHGYTGSPGRSPYRATKVASETLPPVLARVEKQIAEIPAPADPQAEVDAAAVYRAQNEVFRAALAMKLEPLPAMNLIAKAEQAALSKAKRDVLTEKWLPREDVERVQSDQASALQKRLVGLANRMAPRLAGRTEVEVRDELAREVCALLKEWSQGGEIDG